jgi:hypothetical protein
MKVEPFFVSYCTALLYKWIHIGKYGKADVGNLDKRLVGCQNNEWQAGSEAVLPDNDRISGASDPSTGT